MHSKQGHSLSCFWVLILSLSLRAQGPYSGGLNDPDNPYDAPVPGFVGPHGEGKARLLQWDGSFSNPDNILNPVFSGWATGVIEYAPAPSVAPEWDDPSNSIGPVTGDHFNIVSLGDLNATQLDSDPPHTPGSITLEFTNPIRNFSGADFVVFENAIGSQASVFAELAYVEVSTDGAVFARFPTRSLTEASVWAYGHIDPRNVYGLAGKHINASGESWGTPFDLSKLETHAHVINGTVDLNNINYIRIVDIPGRGDFLDSHEDPIYDAWLTSGSGGFDLEAVGAISQEMNYPSWAALQIPESNDRHPNDSPRMDDVPNLFAYALGRSGSLPDPTPVSRAVRTGDGISIEFTRDERAVDLIFEVQISTDLVNWAPLARSEEGREFEALDPYTPVIQEESAHHIRSIGVRRRTRISAGTDAPPIHFLRLHVTQTGEPTP